jgi:mRNA interferase MazF
MNLRLTEAPGNLLIPASDSGLPKDSVANVSQVITVDRTFLTERCGRLPPHLIRSIDDGLRLVLSL